MSCGEQPLFVKRLYEVIIFYFKLGFIQLRRSQRGKNIILDNRCNLQRSLFNPNHSTKTKSKLSWSEDISRNEWGNEKYEEKRKKISNVKNNIIESEDEQVENKKSKWNESVKDSYLMEDSRSIRVKSYVHAGFNTFANMPNKVVVSSIRSWSLTLS